VSNPLHAYAGINETIKQVVETSYRLNVRAFNALFVSRRVGRWASHALPSSCAGSAGSSMAGWTDCAGRWMR